MRKKLSHNLGLKLASLALAFILWFLVVQIEDPVDSVTFRNVEVRLVNTELLDQENKVYEILDNTNEATVTVYAPKSILGQIRKTDIVAEADMSKLTDINTIAINYYVESVAIDDIEGNRDVVRLNVEEKSSKWLRLVSNTLGEVADGYMIYGTSLDQTNIEITGPESVVADVEYAGVDIAVNEATTNLSANIDIQLYDAEGELVENSSIRKNVDSAYMTVEVLAYKEVPVRVEYMGVPAEGYMATGVTECNYRRVTIAGRSSALDAVREIVVPEEAVDITGADSDMTAFVDLSDYLPDNVRWADRSFSGRVTATVYIQPIVTRDIETGADNIQILNLPTGFSAKLPEDVRYYALTIYGLGEEIAALQEENVRGVIDVGAYFEGRDIDSPAPGTYEIPIEFALEEHIGVSDTVTAHVELISLGD